MYSYNVHILLNQNLEIHGPWMKTYGGGVWLMHIMLKIFFLTPTVRNTDFIIMLTKRSSSTIENAVSIGIWILTLWPNGFIKWVEMHQMFWNYSTPIHFLGKPNSLFCRPGSPLIKYKFHFPWDRGSESRSKYSYSFNAFNV